MAELTGFMALNNDQCVLMGEEGITLLIQKVDNGYGFKEPKLVMSLDAAAATRLLDFLLIYKEQLVRWRDGFAS